MWTIEFAAIIRDAPTALHAIDFLVGFILIYGCILVLLWIAGVFLRFILGTEKKDPIENTEADEPSTASNTKDPIEKTEADEPSLPSLSTGAVSTTTPPSSSFFFDRYTTNTRIRIDRLPHRHRKVA